MSAVPVYFSLSDDSHWGEMPRSRALEWTRVFLVRRPSVPSTAMWMVSPALERGVPAGFSDWAVRARLAEMLGFSPAGYELLQAALDVVPATDFPEHPDNHLIRTGLAPVRPFDPHRWGPWPALVAGGATPEAAARLLLARGDGAAR